MKTRYHPFIILAYQHHFLPQEYLKQIPPSTRHYWQYDDMETRFGLEFYAQHKETINTLALLAQYQSLLQVTKALLKIIVLLKNKPSLNQTVSAHRAWWVKQIQGLTTVFPKHKILKILQLSAYQFQTLVQPFCKNSLLHRCRQLHPHQLLPKEITILKQYLTDPQFLHWSMASLYYKLREEQAVMLSLSCFYRYKTLLGISRPRPAHRRKKHSTGIRSFHPYALLHADTTIFTTTAGIRYYIHVIQDNFSRYILGIKVVERCKAQHVLDLLREVQDRYPNLHTLPKVQLLTDNGSENAGVLRQYLLEVSNKNIEHLIAQKDTPFSNSMIEACHKSIKYNFLYHKQIHSLEELKHYAHQAVEDYNHRNKHALEGLTPHQVLHGLRQNKEAQKQLMELARKQRVIENKNQCCTW